MHPLRWHRPLLVAAGSMVVLAVVALGGVLVDDRVFLGAPVWAKALKFAISVAVYTLTVAWLLSLTRRAPRLHWWLGTVVAVTLLVEMVFVVVQVVRAEPSHFGGPFSAWGAFVGDVMGGTIMVFLAATMVLALGLAFQRIADPPTRSAIRAGLVVSLAGMLTGFLMFANTKPDQVARLRADEPTLLGSHTVGAPDGGAHVPVTYWSSTGGDLRVPHFVGLHALQALPLLALGLYLLARRFSWLRDEHTRVWLVRVFCAGYAGFFALTLWQAMRGQPVFASDGQTLAALGGLAGAVGLASALVLWCRPVSNPLVESLDDRITV